MSSQKKILIITGGPKKKLDGFRDALKGTSFDVTLASFSELEYFSHKKGKFIITIQGKDLSSFKLIYIRVVGKRLEDATLLVNYAKEHKIRIIDRLYQSSSLLPSSISKAQEIAYLIKAGIRIPPTYFGSLRAIALRASKLLGFPYVLKSTSGKKARDVWLPKDEKELGELMVELRNREKTGEKFLAQKFIHASQRFRVFIIDKRVLGAITRPTKWRKRFVKKVDGDFPEPKKEALIPVPPDLAKLAKDATEAVKLDIAGVDILKDDKNKKLYVIEANAAPSWNLIKKDTGIDVEKEILEYLASI